MLYLKKFIVTAWLLLLSEAIAAADTLTVQVSDTTTGAPIQAAVSAIGGTATVYGARTDENGVAILKLPSLDQISVAVRTDSHSVKCFDPEQTASGNLVVRLEPSIRVYGVVKGAEGVPLEGASIKVVYGDEDNCQVRFDRAGEITNSRGEYVLRNVDATRKFTVVFRHDHYLEKQITKDQLLGEFSGPSATQKEVNVELTPRS